MDKGMSENKLTPESMNEMFKTVWGWDGIKLKVQTEEWLRKEHILRFGYDPYTVDPDTFKPPTRK